MILRSKWQNHWERFQEGIYNNIEDPNVLAALSTNDVYSVYRDEHCYVEYNTKLANEVATSNNNDTAFIKGQIKKDRSKNFGFKEVKYKREYWLFSVCL